MAAGNLKPVKVNSDHETLLPTLAATGRLSPAGQNSGETTAAVNSRTSPPGRQNDRFVAGPPPNPESSLLNMFRNIDINGFFNKKEVEFPSGCSQINRLHHVPADEGLEI